MGELETLLILKNKGVDLEDIQYLHFRDIPILFVFCCSDPLRRTPWCTKSPRKRLNLKQTAGNSTYKFVVVRMTKACQYYTVGSFLFHLLVLIFYFSFVLVSFSEIVHCTGIYLQVLQFQSEQNLSRTVSLNFFEYLFLDVVWVTSSVFIHQHRFTKSTFLFCFRYHKFSIYDALALVSKEWIKIFSTVSLSYWMYKYG
jgi:hypothetical protein